LLSAYCATKHALDSAAASLDIEGRPFNVRAPSVLPGQFQTSIAIKGPAAIVSEPYEGIAVALAASRDARRADVLADLSPVSEAVIAAATDADPKPRYMIGAGIAQNLLPALAEFERLHALEVARCGLPARAA
jgi:NAD(P)-dependent dehydrogenase (short-subunit alcohol dehydrogenase family)